MRTRVKRVPTVLAALDEAFDKRSWHGTNLRGSLRGMSRTTARWRPAPDRHNIWELVVHAAYWKYAVRRRLTGEKRGSFPLERSNWWVRPDDDSEGAWKRRCRAAGGRTSSVARGCGRAAAPEVRRACPRRWFHICRANPRRSRARPVPRWAGSADQALGTALKPYSCTVLRSNVSANSEFGRDRCSIAE
jgi:DinB superfamily